MSKRQPSKGGRPSMGNSSGKTPVSGGAPVKKSGGRTGPAPKMPSKAPAGIKQDFFPRSASAAASSKTQGFLFNQAPINKNEVREEAKERVAASQIRNKRSAFVARLYNDEEEPAEHQQERRGGRVRDIENEMKVFDMNNEDGDSEEEESKVKSALSKKRDSKTAEKKGKSGTRGSYSDLPAQKIGKLKFSPGSLGLFAIAEVHPNYLIVNFTRNTKGFIALADKDQELNKHFEVGQYVTASIAQTGTSQFNTETSGLQNKKLQLSLALESINKSLTVENISSNMTLQGELVAKEAKGFLVNFGLKDRAQGFLPFDQASEHLQLGQIVHLVVRQVMASSKIIKCELVKTSTKDEPSTKESNNQENSEGKQKPLNNKELTKNNIKPGFLVTAKVQRTLDNGIELNFLGGHSGTVFVDHLDRPEPNKYKLGEKVTARIVSVDTMTQTITLSLLPHLVKFENISKQFLSEGVLLGKLYEKVPVKQVAFGDSYKIGLTPSVQGFLHKIHAVKKEKEKKSKKAAEEAPAEEDGEELEAKTPQYTRVELEKGQKIDRLRVKELNYFDGVPILSMRDDIVSTAALTYDSLICGQYLNATIEEVNAQDHYVVMKVNDFVRGRLYIENMADLPLKMIPPKFTSVGKELKVRVFYLDVKTRYIEFTKKDSFFKEKTPVYQSYRDAQKGAKIVGVIVDQNEHGYVVKSFGGIKGLLTFADIKQCGKQFGGKDLKAGSIVKAYVLFRKKDKGMALTMDKAKAKELRKEQEEKKAKTSDQIINDGDEKEGVKLRNIEQQYPNTEQMEEIKEKYKSLIKISQDRANIGKVFQFRVVETASGYFLCKSLNADKKSKNFVAVLPKALVNKFFLNSLTLEDHVFDGLVLEIQEDALPILSAQHDLLALKASIPKSNDEIVGGSESFVGFVSSIAERKGVNVSFIDGLKKLILVKDLETVQNFADVYKVGKVVRVAMNKLDRLTLKAGVMYHREKEVTEKSDKEVQIKALYESFKAQHEQYKLKAGERVEAFVSLAKEYGNIVGVEKFPSLTGFILTEHLVPKKDYKEGQKLNCVVLDMDFEKEILDLSERLAEKGSEKNPGTVKVGHQYRATVELNKEDYLLLSFKQSSGSIGLVMLQSLNDDQVPSPNEKYQIGDEIEVRVVEVTDSGFVLTVPAVQASSAEPKVKGKSFKQDLSTLTQGSLVSGVIKSIKNQCAFVQLSNMSQLLIGRLHRLECQSGPEFDGFSIGESIKAKILKISSDKGKTWIELTRRRDHMNKPGDQLDEGTLKKTYFGLEDLKAGEQYDAVITDVNYAFSQPIHITVSPFIKGSISFSKIVDADVLLNDSSSFLQKFKPGSPVKVYYTADGDFSLIKPAQVSTAKGKSEKLSKGDIFVVRLVKGINGKGITVQLSTSQFGFIEMAEITDDLVGSVIETLALIQPLFVARIIGFDKNQKPILSSRESIVQAKSWEMIGPQGKSAHFQKFDEKNQLAGNQRNKILKYGADVALHEGDLCVGYVTNIGKSGCFIQIGHNCTVRAGLNELSDSSSFNFAEQMPLGRLVLARIYKVDDVQGKKRFNVTLRKSLVVHGVNAVNRDTLSEGTQVECIVAAVVEGGTKAFAQIKGSYLKLKVKDLKPGQVTEGDQIVVSLKKVTKQKITATLEGKTPKAPLDEKERKVERLWSSIEEEAQKDIEAMKVKLAKGEVDQEKLKALGEDGEGDEVERQYRDLKELGAEEGDDMETVQDDDSDAEEMQRIIKESKVYEDEEEEEEEDEEMEGLQEEDEDDDEEMEDEEDEERFGESSDEDEEEKTAKGKSGKTSLKARIKEEQEIRLKEKNMRGGTDVPTSVDDFERLVVSNTDQSFVWIQYMAFMLDNLGAESARRVAERAVKSVSISNEDDKLNLWVAYMNLENNFGTQQTLEKVVKRALEVNDRQKIYLQLINMYQSSQKYQFIEDIYKQLIKKFSASLSVWTGYLEFLFTVRQLKRDRSAPAHVIVAELEVSEPKQVLQRALQSLPKDSHVNLISKFGMLEFKHGQPENGRTMFEGIVSNYPKRMDIWSIYMDMEVKYGGAENRQQARHLFERCLANEFIMKKPKKMKLVFQKYMEYELQAGNKKQVEKLRERVEKYLEKAFTATKNKDDSESADEEMA